MRWSSTDRSSARYILGPRRSTRERGLACFGATGSSPWRWSLSLWPRHPDDPVRVPDRVRHPGARAVRSAHRPGRAGRDRPDALVLGLRGGGVPGGHRLDSRGAALRRAGAGTDPGAVHAVRGAAAGGEAGGAAAPERLHRAAEGRGARVDPRAARSVPGGADRGVVDVQLHAAGGGGVPVPAGDGPDGGIVDRMQARTQLRRGALAPV
jgi:hypothetical protein